MMIRFPLQIEPPPPRESWSKVFAGGLTLIFILALLVFVVGLIEAQ